MRPASGVLLILGGPSASGKTTLLKLLVARRNTQLLLTSTSRPPRPTEGAADYDFLTPAAFAAALAAGEMPEHTVYAGVDYGVSSRSQSAAADALAAGMDVAAALDARGVLFFREWAAAARVPLRALYLDAPEADVRRRLAARGSAAEEVERRLRQAAERERAPAYVAAFDARVAKGDGLLEEAYAQVVARLA